MPISQLPLVIKWHNSAAAPRSKGEFFKGFARTGTPCRGAVRGPHRRATPFRRLADAKASALAPRRVPDHKLAGATIDIQIANMRQSRQKIAKQLDRVQRELDALREIASSFDPYLPKKSVTADWIRDMLRAKRRRDALFPAEGFGDPGWDLLLELYSVELTKEQIATSDLCAAAAVAPTTALRWLGQLEASGLIVRTRDKSDKRRVFVNLSPKGVASMRQYFGSAKRG